MSKPRVALWEGIHAYVRACGGDPEAPNAGAMDAVVKVERAVDEELEELRKAMSEHFACPLKGGIASCR